VVEVAGKEGEGSTMKNRTALDRGGTGGIEEGREIQCRPARKMREKYSCELQ
jgi:hypothetical protein